MRLISASQSRAARGLLNWSQPDLAERCGIHVQTISSFEHETGSPTKRTLQKITETFEMAGIEFTPNGGIEPRQSNVVTLKGLEGFSAFRSKVMTEARKAPLNVCVSNVDERQFEKWGKGRVDEEYFSFIKENMPQSFRILVKQNDTYFPASWYATYRWLPEDRFGKISFYLFGEKTALISFEDSNFQAFIIHHKAVNDFYRKEFENLWKLAHHPAIPNN